MIISLQRLTECHHQEHFHCAIPSWFDIQTLIFSALTPLESYRITHSCLVLYADRRDLLLAATAVRIQYGGSGWTVATPPVQLYLQPAIGQGGVWDQESSSVEPSSRALPSSGSDALEDEHTD